MYYNGEHSVTFINSKNESKNSWTDFLLFPTSRPVIALPEYQDFSMEITGRNGSIDFQNYISPQTIFKNRTGEMEFGIDHENDNYVNWTVSKNQIAEFIHGQSLKIILSDEPEFYYEGRFYISDWKNNSDWTIITIHYDLLPYKKSIIASTDAWKWDPFNFYIGYIHDPSKFVMDINSDTPYSVNIIDIKYPTTIKLKIPNWAATDDFMSITVARNTAKGQGVNDSFMLRKNDPPWVCEFILYPDQSDFVIRWWASSGQSTKICFVFNEESI